MAGLSTTLALGDTSSAPLGKTLSASDAARLAASCPQLAAAIQRTTPTGWVCNVTPPDPSATPFDVPDDHALTPADPATQDLSTTDGPVQATAASHRRGRSVARAAGVETHFRWVNAQMAFYGLVFHGVPVQVGSVQQEEKVNLNGRQSQNSSAAHITSGPPIRQYLKYACVRIRDGQICGRGSATAPTFDFNTFSGQKNFLHQLGFEYFTDFNFYYQVLGVRNPSSPDGRFHAPQSTPPPSPVGPQIASANSPEPLLPGVAWLAAKAPGLAPEGSFFGYWEPHPGSDDIEEVDGLSGVDAALAWGRSRASIVLIRLNEGGYYSAGAKDPDWGLDWQRWPTS